MLHLLLQMVSSLRLLVWLVDDLALSESVRVTHQDVLFRLQAHLVEVRRVVAANAGAGRSAVSIVGEAFAVELEASALPTVARLVCHEQL